MWGRGLHWQGQGCALSQRDLFIESNQIHEVSVNCRRGAAWCSPCFLMTIMDASSSLDNVLLCQKRNLLSADDTAVFTQRSVLLVCPPSSLPLVLRFAFELFCQASASEPNRRTDGCLGVCQLSQVKAANTPSASEHKK